MTGMLLVAGGLALASVARTIIEVYFAYGLGVGLGVGCAYVPAVGAVQRWFVKRRAFASGLAVSGIGVGTLVMPILASRLIDHFGWRTAYLVLAGLAAIIGVGMSWLIANKPQDDAPRTEIMLRQKEGPVAAQAGASVIAAVRSRQFAALYLACLISSFGVFVPFVHLVPYALDHHVKPSAAVLLLGAIGIGSTFGRFFLGSLADRIGRQIFLSMMYLGMAAALAIWVIAFSFWPLAVFALLFGTFYGGWVAILPAVVMDRFGGRSVSGILGALYTSVAIGTLIGPSAAGYIYDISQSYTLPVLSSVGANIIAAAIAAIASKSSREDTDLLHQ